MTQRTPIQIEHDSRSPGVCFCDECIAPTPKYTAESLAVCRLADVAHLMNNLEAEKAELLAALREAVMSATESASTDDDYDPANPDDNLPTWVLEARAVIAKAEGVQS